MEKISTFFVPHTTDENREAVYIGLAQSYNYSVVPELGKRIYSIRFIHNSEEWIATVGEKLHGTKTKETRSKGNKTTSTVKLQDNATVMAIFPGSPCIVVTNDGLGDVNVRSKWANPFLAGNIRETTYFSINNQ